MKKFKSFIKQISIDPILVDCYPTHGQHALDVNNDIVEKKEVTPPLNSWFEKHDNHHLGETVHHVDHKIGVSRDEFHKHPSVKYVKEYTSFSKPHNNHLIDIAMGKKHKYLDPHPDDNAFDAGFKEDSRNIHKKLVHHMDKFTNKKMDHDLHVYHGSRNFNPGEYASKHPERKIKLPAFTSTSIDKRQAARFARSTDNQDTHILHIHMKKGDKGNYIGTNSHYKEEFEHILPRNTVLKVHPKPSTYEHTYDDSSRNHKTHIWHATIEHQD